MHHERRDGDVAELVSGVVVQHRLTLDTMDIPVDRCLHALGDVLPDALGVAPPGEDGVALGD